MDGSHTSAQEHVNQAERGEKLHDVALLDSEAKVEGDQANGELEGEVAKYTSFIRACRCSVLLERDLLYTTTSGSMR